MATVYIWHGVNGEILAVGRAEGDAQCIPLSGENQSVLELDMPDDSAFSSLARTHFVDPIKKTLVELPKQQS